MLEKTAYLLGRNDEEPNIALAKLLSETKDYEGIREIVEGLKNRRIQIANDCIKVLYEIGERVPELIAEYVSEFVTYIRSKNNRLVWGSMVALAQITPLKPNEVFRNFEDILSAYKNGSVITVDNAITVFAELCRADKKYEKVVFSHIIEHLKTCRPKEVAQHSERAFICINEDNAKEFTDVLLQRKESLTEAQNKRIDKLIKKIMKEVNG